MTRFPTRRALLACVLALDAAPALADLKPVRVSPDGRHLVVGDTGQRFVAWGFNYMGKHGELFEEQWGEDWNALEQDFREMKQLGANTVRVHLQLTTFMASPGEARPAELKRLRRLLDLAERNGLYLDITGLGLYRVKKIPPWLDRLPEAERWEVQARFWGFIAGACKGHPAVFCYCLMNEPVIGGPHEEGENPWLAYPPLEGFHFVQRISRYGGEERREAIAAAWVKKMADAIRARDPRALVTVGVIPWALEFPGARPVFYAPEALKHLDLVSVHLYPRRGEVGKALAVLKDFDLGKPLLIEETFPLSCDGTDLDRFIEGARGHADGFLGHYFGVMPGEREPADLSQALRDEGVKFWRDRAKAMRRP